MSQKINDLADTLSDNLYEKTRAQLNAFLDETNALLAAGDALNEDRTGLAHERLAAFLKSSAAAVHAEGGTTGDPGTERCQAVRQSQSVARGGRGGRRRAAGQRVAQP